MSRPRRAQPRAVTVLFFSAGPRAEFIACFREAARALALELRVVVTDPNPETSAACQVADAAYRVVTAGRDGGIPALLRICRKERVALLVPVLGRELPALSAAVARFRAAGTRVAVSGPAVVRLECDKLAGARALKAARIPIPNTLSIREYLEKPARLTWPVIAKPVAGSASIGIFRPGCPEDLRPFADEAYLVQELWRGPEYTVNMFFDRRGRLRCTLPHRRLAIRSGEVWQGRTERIAILQRTAQRLAKVLRGARGPVGFQAIINEAGKIAVLEINARIGGGYPLTHEAGGNFAGWLLEEAAGLPSTASDRWREGVTMLRYDGAIFLPPRQMT